MIKKIEIENYKSLENLSMELGRFNVLIGENGCGKTNILESLVFAAAGVNNSVENGFIVMRGARISEAKFVGSGFDNKITTDIKIKLFDKSGFKLEYNFYNDNKPFSKWTKKGVAFENMQVPLINYPQNPPISNQQVDEIFAKLTAIESEIDLQGNSTIKEMEKSFLQLLLSMEYEIVRNSFILKLVKKRFPVSDYLIYAPENSFLRSSFVDVPHIEPIGSRGEGLLKLIKVIKKEKPDEYNEIVSHLDLIDWFDNFEVNEDFNAGSEFTLSDKYLEDGLKSFDIRNANEGFLFVLFYLTIFISDYTPKFFAIDNIDTALNPKLCSKLISVLAELAKKHDKQVIITTHNPSVLDGLNLNDEEERLFVIARNKSGRTRATRIEKKPAVNGIAPVKLSEQFLRGYIGGLPKNF